MKQNKLPIQMHLRSIVTLNLFFVFSFFSLFSCQSRLAVGDDGAGNELSRGVENKVSYLKVCANTAEFNSTWPFEPSGVAEPTASQAATMSHFEFLKAHEKTWKPKTSCLPDTLYRWTLQTELDKLIKKFGSGGGILPEETPTKLFFWRSPAGSYGYGHLSYRVKLKPGTQIVPIPMFGPRGNPRDCAVLKQVYDIQSVIFTARSNNLPGYHEYILCGWGTIESASFFTPEHVDELQREKNLYENGVPADYDLMPKFYGKILDPREGFTFDALFWNLDKLQHNFSQMQKMQKAVPGAQGHVFFAPSAEKKRELHFQTAVTHPW